MGAWANQARAGLHIWKFTLKVSINWNAFWFWAPGMYTKHRITRESLGRMFSSVHLHPTSSGARLTFRRRTSCGFCLCFQGGNREFDKTICWCDRRRKAFGNDYNPSQQLWLDAGENRSHSLCTISVNVDCRDEFVVCYGVDAMQSNCLDRIWHYRLQESSVIPRDCEKRLHGSSDLFRSQEAERIFLCETVNSCWQWI